MKRRYGEVGSRRSEIEQQPPAGRPDAVQRQKILRLRGRSVGWVPPLLLLIGITVADANTSGEFRIISWIVLVPGIAAAICGVWGTGAYAVLSLITYFTVDTSWPHQYQTGLPDFILVAVGGILATLACAVRVRGERRMLHMQDVAETTRRTLLRPLAPGWGGLEHAAVYLAADSEARVGGDFYDIQPGLYGTRVLLGDVQGKGLKAVETAAALLGTFRESAYHESLLRTVAERLEIRMLRHAYYCAALGYDEDDRFATAILVGFPKAAWDGPTRRDSASTSAEGPASPEDGPASSGGPASADGLASSGGPASAEGPASSGGPASAEGPASSGGPASADGLASVEGPVSPGGTVSPGSLDTVEVINFGHEPPLVISPDGIRSLPPGDGLPLGLSELTSHSAPLIVVPLASGETLLLVTDGVTEARDSAGVFFPLRDSVAHALAEDPGIAAPQRLAEFVRDATLRHCGGRLADDTTIFAVRRQMPPTSEVQAAS
ncbi:SpoIIE family protein phosphatase [Streptomyces sp. NPDC093544]|uniref:PP2C family protein-serine/threonine phosphatase n=1 Tax=Streptomyces sp. NPDC093544 TaxID=3155200 RepID=UPI003444D458